MDIKTKETMLRLGGVKIKIISERELVLDSSYLPFISEERDADVTVIVDWDWENARKPQSQIAGEDLLIHYYIDPDGTHFAMTRAGLGRYIACTRYDDSCDVLYCTVNEKPFIEPPCSVSGIMRSLPVRHVLLKRDIMLLHASQIGCNGVGIVFTAPSQVGKTTQAKLWKKYRNADIICNDRTLLKKTECDWKTYGYPLDGSEPVRSNQVNSLGCVVVLRQAPVCEINRLGAAKAISLLMSQTVMDSWSGEARERTMKLIAELVKDRQVYLLSCTPEENAVYTLEKKLEQEGVF